eukprot:1990809-Rhodomonas_salina.2
MEWVQEKHTEDQRERSNNPNRTCTPQTLCEGGSRRLPRDGCQRVKPNTNVAMLINAPDRKCGLLQSFEHRNQLHQSH